MDQRSHEMHSVYMTSDGYSGEGLLPRGDELMQCCPNQVAFCLEVLAVPVELRDRI